MAPASPLLFHNRRFLLSAFYTLLFLLTLLPDHFLSAPTPISIHQLLETRGLPPGIFPKNAVKSYSLSEDGLLTVNLDSPCIAKFETRVFFESVVKANLSYGSLIGVKGLSQEELFLWLPVKGIIVTDPLSGLILIDIGLAFKQMALSLFEDPPECSPLGVQVEGSSSWI